MNTNTNAVTKKPINKFFALLVSLVILGCCGLFILTLVLPSSDTTETTVSSNQENSTPTLQPTTIPPTLQPLAPSIQEIFAQTENMTDAQRNQYNESIKGARVENWTGTILDVDEGEILGGFTIYIDMLSENFGAEVHIDVPKEIALSLNKGQTITFSGDIQSVSDILGITVFIENATIVPSP
jgi:hypothetical protein